MTTHLSDEFKKNTSGEIPWNLIKAMRNHYAHGYSFMNNKEIFDTATTDIVGLRGKCLKLLEELESG
ncbi:MAG: HepT-like ribonuclease domain-containing protein [Bacillota bacterium]